MKPTIPMRPRKLFYPKVFFRNRQKKLRLEATIGFILSNIKNHLHFYLTFCDHLHNIYIEVDVVNVENMTDFGHFIKLVCLQWITSS